jgi:hypothetical protein
MAEEAKAISWSPKDALIVGPFLASGLALTWEVGFFVRIKGGAFGLFSIGEHVTFALQALPAALSLVGLLGLSIMVSNWEDFLRAFFGAVGVPSSRAFFYEMLPRIFWPVAFLTAAIGVVVLTKLRVAEASAGHLAFRLGGLLITLLVVRIINLTRSGVILCLGIVFAFTLAFGIGIETAQNEIVSDRPLNVIKVVEQQPTLASEMRVRVLRTGERGVLYFDPVNRSFGLPRGR